MDGAISFFVPGIAKPAGSKRAFVLRRRDGSIVHREGGAPAVVVTDDSGKKGKDWRGDVRSVASRAYGGPLLTGPVWLRLVFVLPRPKAHYTKKGLRPDAPMFHASKPDATKLLRSVEDALTGVLWHDDSAVQIEGATKIYGETPGVHVTVRAIDPQSPEVASLFDGVPARRARTSRAKSEMGENLDEVLSG